MSDSFVDKMGSHQQQTLCAACGVDSQTSIQDQYQLKVLQSQIAKLIQAGYTSNAEYERRLATSQVEMDSLKLDLQSHRVALKYELQFRKCSVREVESALRECGAMNRKLEREKRDLLNFVGRFELKPRSPNSEMSGIEEYWMELFQAKEKVLNLKTHILVLRDQNRQLEFGRDESPSSTSVHPIELDADVKTVCDTGPATPFEEVC